MVTMNQRLDAETLSIVAEEFGYTVEFVTADIEETIDEPEDNPDDLVISFANRNGDGPCRSWEKHHCLTISEKQM